MILVAKAYPSTQAISRLLFDWEECNIRKLIDKGGDFLDFDGVTLHKLSLGLYMSQKEGKERVVIEWLQAEVCMPTFTIEVLEQKGWKVHLSNVSIAAILLSNDNTV